MYVKGSVLLAIAWVCSLVLITRYLSESRKRKETRMVKFTRRAVAGLLVTVSSITTNAFAALPS